MRTATPNLLSRRAALGFAAGAAVLPLAIPRAKAAPVAALWERWTLHEPDATHRIDHGTWNDLLSRYLLAGPDQINRFDYIGVTPEDDEALDRYIDQLSATLISQYNRDQQFSFWLNLYNALVVRLVLDHYPVDSIREIDITPSLFTSGPWGADLVRVEGESVSLDDIEHRILRPIWEDPRVHYVINCAAVGCPQLPRQAMTAENREEMLEEAARAFVNHPRGVRIEDDGLILSSIYDWYASDFGGFDGAILDHLARYAEPELRQTLATEPPILGYEYDWALNDVRGRAGG